MKYVVLKVVIGLTEENGQPQRVKEEYFVGLPNGTIIAGPFNAQIAGEYCRLLNERGMAEDWWLEGRARAESEREEREERTRKLIEWVNRLIEEADRRADENNTPRPGRPGSSR